LIPFVDLLEIRKAIANVADGLTPLEQARNELQPVLIFEDGEGQIFDPKSHVPKEAQPITSPSSFGLGGIPFWSDKLKCTKVFSMASDWESVVIHPEPERYSVPPFKTAQEARVLVKSVILVDWPHLRPALVVGVVDNDTQIPGPNGGKHPGFIIHDTIQKYREIRAIDASKSPLSVEVRPVVFTNLARTRIDYAPKSIYVPYVLTLPVRAVLGAIEGLRTPEDPRPTRGMKVVVIRGQFARRIGKIAAVEGDTAQVTLDAPIEDPPFKEILAGEDDQWMSISDLFRQLRIDPDNGKTFLSSIRVRFKPDGGHPEQYVDFAFTAFGQRRVLDGCCRRRGGDYEVTKHFRDACRSYLERPFVGNLRHLLGQSGDGGMLRVTPDLLYGNGRVGQLLHDLNIYIEGTMLAQRYFLIDEDTCHLSQVTLDKMERLVLDRGAPKRVAGKNAKKVEEKVTVDLADLIWPGKTNPKGASAARIGARVVNIASVGSIDFGVVGTVVTVSRHTGLYGVMLDTMQGKATTLRGRLSSKRGYIAHVDDLFFFDQDLK
jgi:hypothetical protein